MAPQLAVDWVRLSPYPATGTFESRVFDAGQAADWGALTWSSTVPAGTSLAMSVRTGPTPTPDGNWTAFTPVASSGGDIAGNSRYVQYRAEMDPDPNLTPTLSDVSIAYNLGPDVTPPTITQRTPAPNASNVARNTNVDVQFSEAMNPATITGSTVRLRKQGAGSDVPASVSYSGNTATINPNADLDPGAVYNVTVDGTVEDANGNPLGADDTWSFTTVPLTFVDDTTAEFGAGTPGADTYVSETVNGEVTLKPTVGRGVLRQLGPGGLEELSVERPGPELHARHRRHRLGRQPPPGRRLRQDHRHLRLGPLARVRGQLRRREQRARRLRRRPQQLAQLGDLQPQGRRQLQRPHQ